MELLIGSGNCRQKKVTFEGIPQEWIELKTLDIDPGVEPDYVHDLEDLPLPFDDSVFDEIHAYEVLEHTGQQGDWRFFFNQFYEFWRILKPGGYLIGSCPMWDTKWAWSDPGHKRIISPESLVFLSQKEYKTQVGVTAMTDYRDYWDGDFQLIAKQESNESFGFVIQAIKD
jgi:SAM-dependent methyltransferase